jgi:hypothetical protein
MAKITHGGRRKGSGRKPGVTFKEPTKVIRVPLSKVGAVLKVISNT